ncbi:hypothetical protein SKAU_G00266610 [Synaphobranchus kaupii]|uniref:Uncharacterized protein n=1 Tax=Synaphobranchus kaupii TaxID=118154 RepID=A0A9Q1EZG1_SYNKA|nr:hypothetical protein SKAU_G00266610 [Synaphobranchus kaupii]
MGVLHLAQRGQWGGDTGAGEAPRAAPSCLQHGRQFLPSTPPPAPPPRLDPMYVGRREKRGKKAHMAFRFSGYGFVDTHMKAQLPFDPATRPPYVTGSRRRSQVASGFPRARLAVGSVRAAAADVTRHFRRALREAARL